MDESLFEVNYKKICCENFQQCLEASCLAYFVLFLIVEYLLVMRFESGFIKLSSSCQGCKNVMICPLVKSDNNSKIFTERKLIQKTLKKPTAEKESTLERNEL